MNKINLLVFPCGSEIGLEIHRSLRYSSHVNLIGGSSVDDHGRFIYENYIGDLPFIKAPDFIKSLKKIVKDYQIDAIYPAMDAVITELSRNAGELGCRIIGSPLETTEICLSKSKTYQVLSSVVPVATQYSDFEQVVSYPVFVKPDIGYGSRGAKRIDSREEGLFHSAHYPESIIVDFIPGPEYTVDCFTNKRGELLFFGPRVRHRVMNGISVNTFPYNQRNEDFRNLAEAINRRLVLRGAWFFQVKENAIGKLVLLEVAGRLGGSSALYRNVGVNFALLSVLDAFGLDVKVHVNSCNIEMDRALGNRYRTSIQFETAYVDFDDCVIIRDEVNSDIIKLIFQLRNKKRRLVLLTKHEYDIHKTLERFRLSHIFDEVIHLDKADHKYRYIKDKSAIFIDDSYAERSAVFAKLGIPVFAPDAIECLLDN